MRALLLCCLHWSLLAAPWPQWRGPQSSGVSPESGLPAAWGPEQNIAWKTELPGRGHSSPVVWGNRIFVTAAEEGETIPGAQAPVHIYGKEEFKHPDALGADKRHRLLVLALDRDSGRIVWQRVAHDGRVYDDRHKKASYANATPVTDGEAVYAYFGTEGLHAYTLEGKPLWQVMPGKIPTIGLGVASSPVLDGGRLFLQCDVDSGDGSFLVAVDKRTGKELWRTSRTHRASWSTPLVLTAGARKELVASGAESVIAYDPANGQELWRSRGVEGHAVPSPVAGFGMVFPSAGFPAKRVLGIQLGGAGEVTEQNQLKWSYEKGAAYVPSPILYGDYLYVMSDRGLLTCLDARTGRRLYEGARVPKAATFTASPVAYGGHLLLTSEEGETFVVKAGPAHEILRTNAVGEAVYASPALSDGRVYIRGERRLFCIRAAH